jgi:hypothetical protein
MTKTRPLPLSSSISAVKDLVEQGYPVWGVKFSFWRGPGMGTRYQVCSNKDIIVWTYFSIPTWGENDFFYSGGIEWVICDQPFKVKVFDPDWDKPKIIKSQKIPDLKTLNEFIKEFEQYKREE